MTTDHTCVALGDGAEPGEQPDMRPNRSATETGSERPEREAEEAERQKGEKGRREPQTETQT